jgi:hypothetical protein
MNIKEWDWDSRTFPIPFFQTWCCQNSSVTPSLLSPSGLPAESVDIFDNLMNAGLPPKMYECVRNNLVLNQVGVDCIHYLFNDAECREFIAHEYPPDVLRAYDRLIPTAFKSDLWRYCVLYKYGGVYLDVKLEWGFRPPMTEGGVEAEITLRSIVQRWLSGSKSCVDCLLVLERDGVGLWPTGHFGIHNAFIITKPKNPLLLDCIFNIVSSSKNGGLGDIGSNFCHDGWMTRPLFVTGPGLLGNVWREHFMRTQLGGGGGGGVVPDSYATMAPYFRLFFEGDGVIGYFIDAHDGLGEEYIKLLKVYHGYQEEYRDMMRHTNCVPHYTILWSQGVIWSGGGGSGGGGGGSGGGGLTAMT